LELPIREIRQRVDVLRGKAVMVRGFAHSREPEQADALFREFYLRDEYGDLILISTSLPFPEIGAQFWIEGAVEQRDDQVYLSESERTGPIREGILATTVNTPVGRTTLRAILLYALAGAIVVLAGAIVQVDRRRRRRQLIEPGRRDALRESLPPAQRAPVVELPTGKSPELPIG